MKNSNMPVAIITGAGSGIGRAVAQALSAKDYRLALVGRRESELLRTGQILGRDKSDWIAINSDLTKSDDRSRIIDQTMSSFGRIDTLVNNAGLGTCKTVGELSESEILELFAVNATGPIDLVRRAINELVLSKGSVVNVASIAIVDPFIGLGIYGCSKAAVDGLTRALHNEYNKQGIRAYTIAPGAVETDMLRSIVSKDLLPTDQTLTPQQVAEKIVACITGDVSENSGSTIFVNSQSD
tara:strand:+ start:525 stop:1244 length:720 start_codon:yes stop_codon:yes gene_type:complete